MTKHFETREAAITDLKAHGFHEIKNGRWVNNVCAANILTTFAHPIVAVQYWEIERAA